MKIISKFKDYYDGGASHGIDSYRKYIRETREIKLSHKQVSDLSTDLLGFCGELFILDNWYTHEKDPKKFVLWDKDAVTKTWKWSAEEDYKLVDKAASLNTIDPDDYINRIKNSTKYLNIFQEYKTPIWFIDYYRSKLIINPRLKDFGFAKFYDTIQAFQKIEQYISNDLVSSMQKEVPVGDNEVIGRSKGFDEYSFRNAKKKPKKF